MNRHDYSTAFRNVMDKALEVGTLDAWGLAELLAGCGKDEVQGVEDVCLYAHMDRHSPEGQERHAAVVKAAEEFWMDKNGLR